MEFVVFSDLQYDLYSEVDDRISEEGLTSRLKFCSKALRHVGDYCRANGVTVAVCTGDFFDKKSNTSAFVLHQARLDLRESFEGVRLYLLGGNHDYLDKTRNRALQDIIEAPNIISVPKSKVFQEKDNVVFAFVPDVDEKLADYSKLKDMFSGTDKTQFHVMFAHVGLFGAMLNSTRSSDSEVTLKELHPEVYDLMFLGDYHRHQTLLKGKAWYVGALLQKTFGNEGDPQQFAHVVVNKTAKGYSKSVKFVQLPKKEFPEFRTVDFDTEVESDFYGYLKIRSSKARAATEVEAKRDNLPSDCLRSILEVPVKSQDVARVDFTGCVELHDQILRYIDETVDDVTYDKDYLKSLVKEFI